MAMTAANSITFLNSLPPLVIGLRVFGQMRVVLPLLVHLPDFGLTSGQPADRVHYNFTLLHIPSVDLN
jgi:hypothetical protein